MIKSSRFRRVTLSVHNWVGLIIAVQFLFWCVGGIVMSIIPIEVVRGEVNIAEQAETTLSGRELSTLMAKLSSADIVGISVKSVAGRRVAVVEMKGSIRRLYDAATGTILTPVDEALARQVAVNDYQKAGLKEGRSVSVVEAKYLTEEPGDFRRSLPVWQITLNDPEGTRIYVSPETGDVMARRNDYWRVYDFFWMLHIMDYDTRDDFNNPLIIIASITATLFVISGFILLYFRFWPAKTSGLFPNRYC